MRKITQGTKKVMIGLAGWSVLLVGIVMIPYPGPGWLVVFLGLTILGTEFDWAKKIHDKVHDKYSAWEKWLATQSTGVRVIFWILTCLTAIVTIWLLNGYGLINQWLDLGQDWVASPLSK